MERKTKVGVRLDRWLKERFPALRGRHLDEAIAEGLVVSETGARLRKGDRVASDDAIDCNRLRIHLEKLRRGNAVLPVKALEERDDILVVDKPAGLPSHPLSLFDETTVTHWAFAHYPSIAGAFEEAQPTITPHRLDTGTSGVLIVAKNREAFDRWRERFQRKEVGKRYLAWCWGNPEGDRFTIQTSIAHAPGVPGKMVAIEGEVRGKPPELRAESEVRILKRRPEDGVFLASVTCRTGVTHQVRVHLASRGFPLVGDTLYDASSEDRPARSHFHRLRAVELSWGEERFLAPCEAFEADPFSDSG